MIDTCQPQGGRCRLQFGHKGPHFDCLDDLGPLLAWAKAEGAAEVLAWVEELAPRGVAVPPYGTREWVHYAIKSGTKLALAIGAAEERAKWQRKALDCARDIEREYPAWAREWRAAVDS